MHEKSLEFLSMNATAFEDHSRCYMENVFLKCKSGNRDII